MFSNIKNYLFKDEKRRTFCKCYPEYNLFTLKES